MKKAIIIPGNGCDANTLDDCMWYPYVARMLSGHGINIELRAFPDPLYAHENIWKSFAVDTLGLDDTTVIIGHSSGAACALRLMEEHNIYGCVLVSAYNSDLGDSLERESGYFTRPFDYDKMLRNVKKFVVQFHSRTDHLVPLSVGREVAEGFTCAKDRVQEGGATYEYFETPDDGHFQEDEYPEFVKAILSKRGHASAGDNDSDNSSDKCINE
eukprot:PhM_4_TR10322/c0_g1_i1/m.20021/K07002/K07002; uncharacterized protein